MANLYIPSHSIIIDAYQKEILMLKLLFKTSSYKVGTNRLKALSDGLFAIVMTLLILDIKVPDLPSHVSNHVYAQAILSIIPSIFTYALSFLLIARYWVMHNFLFINYRKADAITIKCVATLAKDLMTSLSSNRSPNVATAIFMPRTSPSPLSRSQAPSPSALG